MLRYFTVTLSLRIFFIASIFACIIFPANWLLAQSSSSASAITPLPPVDFSGSLLSMFKGLAICIAMLLAAVWVLKKIKSPLITGQGRNMRILERLPVSTKSSVLMLEVDGRKMLVGVGSDPVSFIANVDDSFSQVADEVIEDVVQGNGNA